ncbi:nitroreductase family protein [Paenibacillus hexagrammi]|uniref:Putative NAD(P)H nitroreductase n=1 Tax=Paenibacillus hexagrammi TaxID=2908839 RepID=A0ABY3SJ21_9BACL|nr:nitroreductase [Paenibacillus sp. YPD9-1]UJF32982.1 nitroreductase [Paenibacillus sp. YPD9-1]
MNVKEAILSRRSIGKVKQDAVPEELVQQVLEAAVWAPNHGQTEPWRFWVMTGEGRKLLGRGYAEVAIAEAGDISPDEIAELRAAQEKKALRAPVVIAVAVTPTALPGVPEIEEYAAAHAAVHNMSLMAHALGLGTIWRTGAPTYHPKMKEVFGLQGAEELVGFVYIGYPEREAPEGKRTPHQQKTVWVRE